MSHGKHVCEFCGDTDSSHEWKKCPYLIDENYKNEKSVRSGLSSSVLPTYTLRHMNKKHGFKSNLIDKMRQRNSKSGNSSSFSKQFRFESVDLLKKKGSMEVAKKEMADPNSKARVFYSGEKVRSKTNVLLTSC